MVLPYMGRFLSSIRVRVLIMVTSTEWSTIQRVIGRVISKSAECAARGRFEIKNTIIPELYDTKSYYQLMVTITKFEKNITVV